MKKIVLFVAAVMTFAACAPEMFLDVSSDLATSVSSIKQEGNEFTFSIESNESWAITTDEQTWYSFDVTEGSGSAEVTITVTENDSINPRSATFMVVGATTGAKEFSIVQSGYTPVAQLSELLIEEIFFAKNAVVESGKPDSWAGDQYIKITNTTDHVVYADHLAIAESKLFTQNNLPTTYDPDKRPTHAPVSIVFVIPGDGDDHPIEAGSSILVAATAQDYTTANANSMDLSVADFEWFDNSTVESVQDTDNPDVPNVEIWFTASKTLTSFNMQGNKGYVIARLPKELTAETFLSEYKWVGTESTDFSDFGIGIIDNDIQSAYLFPNEWVLDAVTLSHEDAFTNLVFDSSLDAGYTYCGTTSEATDRYGKAVIRKRDANGKLFDSNNSAVDFTPHTTPSVKIGK
ncbi:MAG: DUF4876 domain-containing protein [Alistipes sp.]|nr:DUF4876 domain-containing protein [Alistipes sp.]